MRRCFQNWQEGKKKKKPSLLSYKNGIYFPPSLRFLSFLRISGTNNAHSPLRPDLAQTRRQNTGIPHTSHRPNTRPLMLRLFPERENYWVYLPTLSWGVKALRCCAASSPETEQPARAAIRAAHTGLFCCHCRRTESLRFLELIFARQAAADRNDEGRARR